ncbi:MAG: hypothetical protein V1839_02815 [archaeon]
MSDNHNYAEHVAERLKRYKKEDIVFTYHAQIQATFRQIDLNEVTDNLANPKRLVLAVKGESAREGTEKFDCLFDYGKNKAHRYIITINAKLIVVTVININRKWQHRVDKYAKV